MTTVKGRFQLIFGLLLSTVVLAGIANLWAFQTAQRLTDLEARRLQSFKLADELRQSSDDLTRMARTYAATGDDRFREYFNNILKVREGAIDYPPGYSGVFWDFVVADRRHLPTGGQSSSFQERMRQLGFSEAEFAKLREAEQNSNALVALEEVAMNAVAGRFKGADGKFTVGREPDQRLALELLFGDEYHQAKASIMAPIQQFLDLIEARTSLSTETLQAEQRRILAGSAVLVLLALGLAGWAFLYLRGSVIGPLRDLGNGIDEFRRSRRAIDVRQAQRADEIGVIARGFQSAAEEVAKHIEEIDAAREALAESAEKIRTILQDSPIGISIVSHSKNKRIYVNARLNEMMTGDPNGSIVDEDIGQSYADPAMVDEVRKELAARGFHYDAELMRRRSDGLLWWCLHSWRPIQVWGEDAYICWHVDITERRQAEEELRAKERLLRSILDSSPVGIAVTTAAGERKYINARRAELDGRDRDEMLTEAPVSAYANPMLREEYLRQLEVEGHVSDQETEMVRADGTTYWVLLTLVPIEYEREPSTLAWLYDITVRKAAEQKIRDAERQLTSILENSPIGVSMRNRYDGSVAFSNSRMGDLFGMSVEEYAATPIMDFYVGDGEFETLGERFERDGAVNAAEVRQKRKEGDIFWASISIVPVESSDDIGAIAWVEDITVRKEAETRLRDAYDIITGSIDYATRIQRSVLPAPHVLSETFREHFVIWEPRDRVGGDIYWRREWGGGHLLLVADCTGHGVPGAFMTLIATAALDRALEEAPTGDPGALIARMHEFVQRFLGQQDVETTTTDDGLELGACFVTADRGELRYAGARFSLFCVADGEFEEIRGERTAIGYKGIAPDLCFATRVVADPERRTFYLTTDGLIDQIGGPRRRSFGKRRLRDVLLPVQNRPMERQRDAILAALAEYQGDEARRDDVSVVGFRV